MRSLVLSLFPGIGLFDQAFEESGFCVVRGPDLLWGGDVRAFHVPRGRFDGVIGGPPCKAFSRGAARARAGEQNLADNLIPEFVRVVEETQPEWYVAENVPESPNVVVDGYALTSAVLDNRIDCGGIQRRARRFSFGVRGNTNTIAGGIERVALHPDECIPTVTSNATLWDPKKGRARSERSPRYLAVAIRAQGLPSDFTLPCASIAGAIAMVAQGVPLPMGRIVARAVLRSVYGRVQAVAS